MLTATCGKCHLKHTSIEEARACWQGVSAAISRPASQMSGWSVGAKSPSPWVERKAPEPLVTYKQLDYISKLGGDVETASHLTRKAASDLIQSLQKQKKEKDRMSTAPNRVQTKVPLEMLHLVPDGWYAVRPDSTKPYTFFRVSRPKSGNFKDCLKIQTQHGEDYKLMMVVYPGDRVQMINLAAEDDLLLVVVDPNGAGIAYGQKIGHCMRCGKTLTDERSRYYGIGPECERYWPHIIEIVDDTQGAWHPGL